MKPSSLLFFSTLILGTLMAMSSSSWFTAWLGLEMNLLSFMPMLINSPNSTQSAIKYFLMQAIASMLMITAFTTPWPLFMHNLLFLSLALKLGAAPLHFWLPHTVKNISWPNTLILLTWQKVAPLTLISNLKSPLITLVIITSATVGSWGGMNELRIKQLFTYASINHLAWLISLTFISSSILLVYLLMYSSLLFMVLLTTNNLFHVSQVWLNTNSLLQVMFPLTLLSMGGLPPLTGFFPKWITLTLLAPTYPSIALMLVISSLFLLYFYLRTTWTTLALSSTSHITTPPTSFKLWTIMSLSLLTLPLLMLI